MSVILILPLLLLCGCLAPDPGKKEQDTDVGVKRRANQESRAPKALDPKILETRSFGEAPMLSKRVAQGQLPSVAKRLPEHPLVVVPMDTIGVYGGSLRRALTGDIVQTAGTNKTLSESLMGLERPLPKSVVLNLAEHYEYQNEGRVAIFKIRKGIKWSDGHPFTVDDILFWYHDMQMNENARDAPLPPSVWLVDGKPIGLDKVDDHTLKIFSPKPLGRVLFALSLDNIAYPKHVFSQYHPQYNPNATYEAFRDSTTSAQLIMKPGIPRLSAWVPVEWIRGQRLVYERNPYYWKVDSAGNQLPYADRLVFNVIQDPQVILLKFVNGEIDLFGRYAQIDMFPTLQSEERRGKFELRITGPERGPAFYLNWDTPKSALREAFRNKDVRVALSLAINREEINQIVYHGLLESSGYAFARSSPYFSEALYKKYSTFDLGLAKKLLDDAGYRDSDGDGFREFEDGVRFELNLDVTPGARVSICELVADHWRAIGIKVNLNIGLRDMIWPRRNNGEFDVHTWSLEGPADPLGRLNDWAIMGPNVPFWHRNAFTEGPDWLHEATDLIMKVLTTVDEEDVFGYMMRVQELHAENVPVIVVGFPYHVWGANTRLGNVPYQNSASSVHRGWSRPVYHEQIYIKR